MRRHGSQQRNALVTHAKHINTYKYHHPQTTRTPILQDNIKVTCTYAMIELYFVARVHGWRHIGCDMRKSASRTHFTAWMSKDFMLFSHSSSHAGRAGMLACVSSYVFLVCDWVVTDAQV